MTIQRQVCRKTYLIMFAFIFVGRDGYLDHMVRFGHIRTWVIRPAEGSYLSVTVNAPDPSSTRIGRKTAMGTKLAGFLDRSAAI